MRDEIEKVMFRNGRLHTRTKEQKEMMQRCSAISSIEDPMTAVYCVYHNIPQRRCECGVPLNVKNFSEGWRVSFCSKRCATSSTKTKQKAKNSFIERYGVGNPFQSDKVKEKIRETNLKKYGVPSPLQNKAILERVKKTNMERYGVDCASKSEEVKEKMRSTLMERYGVENPSKMADHSDKIRETSLERYGVAHYVLTEEHVERQMNKNTEKYGVPWYIQSEECKNKTKETLMERYGVDNPMKDEGIKERAKETLMERYGVDNPMKSENVLSKTMRTNEERYGSPFFVTSDAYSKICMERYGSSLYCLSEDFRNKMRAHWDTNVSRPQLRTLEFLLDIDDSIEFKINDRELLSPLEVDILLPEKKIAIEVNGVYWHSVVHKDSSYHIGKTEEALKKGWRLLHFWDYEVLEFPEVVKEVLNNSLEDKVPPGDVLDRRFYPHVEGVKTPPLLTRVGPYECWDCGGVIVE